jgi:hypothetical protein
MTYLHKKIKDYLSVSIRPNNSILEIDPSNEYLKKGGWDNYDSISIKNIEPHELRINQKQTAEYIVVNGAIHYWEDIQSNLNSIHHICEIETRIILVYYSSLWKPMIKLADFLGLRKKRNEMNWISPDDVNSFALLSNFEIVRDQPKLLLPFNIPILSNFINKFIAVLPIIRSFCSIRIAILKPIKNQWINKPSVSVVIPARNEAGNIENALKRTPLMGPNDELIFVEGNSTDNTWETIKEISQKPEYLNKWQNRIKIVQQDGKGKGDAVRKGFSIAENEILMILDADLTVPPEELPKFYNAIYQEKGEFINGCRLVYPMEKKAMRFFNMIGNKFFAITISYLLGTRLKDTLCGTKVLTKKNYQKIVDNRSYFGEFDPFGDFDLIFGANRLGLKIVEVPIKYRDRLYGDTNISRWKHGVILLRMTLFAARKLMFN